MLTPLARAWDQASLGGKTASFPSSAFLCSPCESASPFPLVTRKSNRAPGMSFPYAYVVTHPHHMCFLHFHPHAPLSLPLLPWTCMSGLVHGHFKGRSPSNLAVFADPSLGRVTNTALNEPASLLGSKHLLPLGHSRGRRGLMSHQAHEARSWNYAKGRGWEFGCLAPTPVLPHPGTFRVQGPLKSSGPYGTINPD